MKLSILLKNTLNLSKFCQFFKLRVELQMFRDETNTWKKSPLCILFDFKWNIFFKVCYLEKSPLCKGTNLTPYFGGNVTENKGFENP